MDTFAVIDTETTWQDDVMSIGVAIGDAESFELIDKKYYILTPYKYHGGMYTHALYVDGIQPDIEGPRETVLRELELLLAQHEASALFAYCAGFDRYHLPELHRFAWYDILKLAAYRQYNDAIPPCADCYGTGRLKRGYRVEDIYRLLSGNHGYRELHNALTDAVDELEIMRLLNHRLDTYAHAKIGE